MGAILVTIRQALKAAGNSEKAVRMARYFKSGKGAYGADDLFYGVAVPEQRRIAKQFYKELLLRDIAQLLQGSYHEERFTALEILVMKFELAVKCADAGIQKQIYELYLASTNYINNWDLVDTSAEYIVGAYLEKRSRAVLKKLAQSSLIWERRIAMLSCFHFIRRGDFSDALMIARLLLQDKEDLIHKAVGWMLREIGKRDISVEIQFLDRYAPVMPRVMLRSAIEQFPELQRQYYRKCKFV